MTDRDETERQKVALCGVEEIRRSHGLVRARVTRAFESPSQKVSWDGLTLFAGRDRLASVTSTTRLHGAVNDSGLGRRGRRVCSLKTEQYSSA